ncbi:TIR domain-containing protein [Sphingomonas sp. RIT328]|uniref:TIR domain-containing protein n=1 Tax=Sphingomonas sp. RIT328 TaxID=1470591 RepID=UPI00044C0FEE|nr:TIR domain-containing protein [Sphingomonas sp. RIT328]EZP49953.1 hypothetical protein BW41_03278 [Sphingomonas sp. RIT328]
MSVHQIHVFISHSWSYSGHYDTLAGWIFGQSWRAGSASMLLHNYSVPRTNPILNASNDRQLREAIHNQIRRSHVIVIPTGMYAQYSKWIGKEINGSAIYDKPILAVNPRAQLRTSSVVQNAAAKCVGWSSRSVVEGIWELYYR